MGAVTKFNRTTAANQTDTAASGSVTVAVANVAKLHVGLAKVFPPQRGAYDPDDDSLTGAQCVEITALSGAGPGGTITCTLGAMNTTAQAIKHGYYIRMIESHTGEWITTLAAGIQPAIDGASAAGGGKVRVIGGLGNLQVALTAKDNVELVVDPGTALIPVVGGTSPVLGYTGAKTSISAFTGTVNEYATVGTLASGGSNFARGDVALMERAGIMMQAMRVRLVTGNQLDFYRGFKWSYTTAWTVWRMGTKLTNFKFRGKIANPNGTNAAAISITYFDRLDFSDVEITGFALSQGALVLNHGIDLKLDHCRIDNNSGNSFYCYDIRYVSGISTTHCWTENPAGIFGIRYYLCTDIYTADCQWDVGGRLETYDDCKTFVSIGTRGARAATGITLTSTSLYPTLGANFSGGDGLIFKAEIHNCVDENFVAFSNSGYTDVTLRDCDFRSAAGATTQSITIDATNSNFYLDNVQFDNIGYDNASVVHGVWRNWAPSVIQSGTLASVTSTLGQYYRWGTRVEFNGVFTIGDFTGAVAANQIEITLPVNMSTVVQAAGSILGSGLLLDISLPGTIPAHVQAGTTVGRIRLLSAVTGDNGFLGAVRFVDALANNDVIKVQGNYRVDA